MPAILGLSFLHLFVLVGWMVWVIVTVHRADPEQPGRAFGVSTGVLVRGWKAGGSGASGHGGTY